MPENHENPEDARTASNQGTDENTERLRWPEAETTQSVGGELPVEATQNFAAVGPDSTARVPQPTPIPPETDAERTDTLTPVAAAAPKRNRRRGLVRGGIAAGAVAAALALLYVGDLTLSRGTVPRGTVVADVAIGGLTPTAAESRLREALGPDLHEPVQLVAGDNHAAISPVKAGLTMDWAATIDQAGAQPLNPITRLTSLFTSRPVMPVSHGDHDQVQAAVREVAHQLNRAPAEGTIRFEGARPIAVDPVIGQTVDVDAATNRIMSDWAKDGPVRLEVTEQPVSTTADGVRKALDEIAKPAVSGPVVVHGEGTDASLAPEAIAGALNFRPDGHGGLKSELDMPKIVGAIDPQLAETTKPGRDAKIVLEGGRPVVHPSEDGHGINWDRSLAPLAEVLHKPQDRQLKALYEPKPPKFSTDQANGLGIREVVSEFETGGFEEASGVNIRRTAEDVNGAIIKPGETFSLNGHTGPRGKAQGYVESGIIENGRPGKAVGGGISQFATTLYNASYFAGMQDVEHKEHSYYISRYPMGREATVFQNPDGSSVIDVKFKNNSRSGVMITTNWTPSSVTVKFWSTKQYDVHSETGPKSAPTPPKEVVIPPGEKCSPSTGQPGFTVHDTRTVRDLQSGEVNSNRSTTVYNPHPIIHCGPPPPPGAH